MFQNTLTDRQKGLLAAGMTAATWSLLAIILKFALQYSDSFSIVWYRMLVSFLALFCWFSWKGKLSSLRILMSRPGLLLCTALCLGVNYVGFMKGVELANPASAQIFIQLGPLLLALSGIFIFKEKLTRKQLYGLASCVFGFALFFADRMDLPGNKESFYWGLLWIVIAAVTWAIFASALKVLLKKWQSSEVNAYIYLVVTLMYWPTVDWGSLQQAPFEIHLLFVFLGLNTILAYGCLSIALRYLPATQVSPILTMNPLLTLVFIALIDYMQWTFIPSDPVGLKGYVGAVVALLGIRFVLAKE